MALDSANEVWKPGSFTKNFSWGKGSAGLSELHAVIRIGFADDLHDVPRPIFRERLANAENKRPDYIPMNFFLFNQERDGEDFICVDELVFQALSWDYGPSFDRIALFAFLFSYVGHWKGARRDQRRPALWANAYVLERLASELKWDAKSISANDIQSFVKADKRYHAETSRKLSTNLNYLFKVGRVGDFSEKRISRWWVDCVFLALDRLIGDAYIDGVIPKNSSYRSLLDRSNFFTLTGGATIEKSLAINHLVRLYVALGGAARFSDEEVVKKTLDINKDAHIPNDPSPRGAVHLTNPKILKSIPANCSELALSAGFNVLYPSELEEFDGRDFISRSTNNALAILSEKGIRPTMTIEELLKITRGNNDDAD